jgi:hypothetical protein
MPCTPINTSNITAPPSPPFPSTSIGNPYSPKNPNLPTESVVGPEDFEKLYEIVQFIIPPGTIKPTQSRNKPQDIFDSLLSVLDKFYPFLMLYKFFLPVLNIIICIIEVLCAIPDPFKLIDALTKLFRECIPEFLALFPAFAVIIMVISMLLLLLALLEYMVVQILNFVKAIFSNLKVLSSAINNGDEESILACTRKFGNLFCSLQNLFVILNIFTSIFDSIEAIYNTLSSLPPCSDSSCCNTCSAFIRNNEKINAKTGKLQYFNEKAIISPAPLPNGSNQVLSVTRPEAWQFYDSNSSKELAAINITNPYDVSTGPFFPADAIINKTTPLKMIPYTVDLRLQYNPAAYSWNNLDVLGKRFVKVKDCIVNSMPHVYLYDYQNQPTIQDNGVLNLVGGLFYEDDGSTPILINGVQASLETFLHADADEQTSNPSLSPTDAYTFTDIDYTLKINHKALLSKALITLGCVPSVSLNKNFINIAFGTGFHGNLNLPNIKAAQDCLSISIDALKNNLSESGLATFQATTTVCLADLANQANISINGLVSAGFDQYKSTYSINPSTQFTSKKIEVTVQLKDINGTSLLSGPVAAYVGIDIASRIKGYASFGTLENFVYNNNGSFISYISSTTGGSGTLKVSFENKVFSNLNIPQDITINPSITEKSLDYQFVFSPSISSSINSIGDTDGAPRRDDADVSGGV